MKKIICAVLMMLASATCSAQLLYPRAMQEIKMDGVGNSTIPLYMSYPAAGTKCFRMLDGDLANFNFLGPICPVMGTGFSYNSGTNQINVAQANADWSANSGVSQVLNKPTTLAGYGITDAVTATALAASYYPLGSNPAGYTTLAAARSGIALTTTGTGAATYNSSTGALNIPAPAAVARVYSNPARTLGISYQISATRDAQVSYSLGVEVTGLLSVVAVKSIGYLEYADDAAMTTNLVLVDTGRSGAGGIINLANSGTIKLVGGIPAGKYARTRVNNTGSPTVTFDSAQEVQQ